MEYIKIRNTKYYKLDTIIDHYKKFNKGCKTNSKLIEKHKIPKDEYMYARLDNDNKWIETYGNSKKYDKIFITKTWFNNNYADKLNKMKDDTEIAPNIIKLAKNEMFVDENGQLIEIEVRGEREVDKCYFKVNDVSKGFNMPNLQDTIIDKKSAHKKDDDYKYFYCNKTEKNRKSKIKKLFLTYNGILKVLYSSKNNKTKPFTSWQQKLYLSHI